MALFLFWPLRVLFENVGSFMLIALVNPWIVGLSIVSFGLSIATSEVLFSVRSSRSNSSSWLSLHWDLALFCIRQFCLFKQHRFGQF